MTYNKQIIHESLNSYKSNSAEKRLKTIENLTTHLKIQQLNKVKLTETDKATAIFLRTINIYRL